MAHTNPEDKEDWEIQSWVNLMDWETDAEETEAMDEICKEERHQAVGKYLANLDKEKKKKIEDLTIQEMEIRGMLAEINRKQAGVRERFRRLRRTLAKGPKGAIQMRILMDRHLEEAREYYENKWDNAKWEDEVNSDEARDEIMMAMGENKPEAIVKAFTYGIERKKFLERYLDENQRNLHHVMGEITTRESEPIDQLVSRSVLDGMMEDEN